VAHIFSSAVTHQCHTFHAIITINQSLQPYFWQLKT
jgi:hypothetical protein